MYNQNYMDEKSTVLAKLAYERFEHHISSARAVLHTCREEGALDDGVCESLSHILEVMSLEARTISRILSTNV